MADNILAGGVHGGDIVILPEGTGEIFIPGSDEPLALEGGDNFSVYPDGSGEAIIDGEAYDIPAGSEFYMAAGEGEYYPVDGNNEFTNDIIDVSAGDEFAAMQTAAHEQSLLAQYPQGGYVEISQQGEGEVFLPGSDEPLIMSHGDSYEIYPDGSGELVIDGDAQDVPAGTDLYLAGEGQATFTPYDAKPVLLGQGDYVGGGDVAQQENVIAADQLPKSMDNMLASCGVSGGLVSDYGDKTPGAGGVGSSQDMGACRM